MQIYNTLSRKVEKFKPRKQHITKIYFCGPTPYNYAHIGNLRNYVTTDIIIKTFRFLGYKVQTLMNLTDIDDKTIRDSQALGIYRDELTKKYTSIFLDDLEKLSIQKADTFVPI